MRKILGISKALRTIQGELVNNITKLTDSLKKGSKKLKQVQDDPTYPEDKKAAI